MGRSFEDGAASASIEINEMLAYLQRMLDRAKKRAAKGLVK